MIVYKRPWDWTRWFAWRPVRVDDRDVVWLERVERRYSALGRYWEYRRA